MTEWWESTKTLDALCEEPPIEWQWTDRAKPYFVPSKLIRILRDVEESIFPEAILSDTPLQEEEPTQKLSESQTGVKRKRFLFGSRSVEEDEQAAREIEDAIYREKQELVEKLNRKIAHKATETYEEDISMDLEEDDYHHSNKTSKKRPKNDQWEKIEKLLKDKKTASLDILEKEHF